jgi:protein-S-isoprenylcysteine O-methyltransferase Ste14
VEKVGKLLFKLRGYTPIPFALILLVFSKPNIYLIIVGTLLVLVGEFIRIMSVGYSGAIERSPQIMANSLVTAGPYAHVRNPIYIGNYFWGLGFVLVFNVWMPYIIALYTLGFFVQYWLIVREEEIYLKKKFEQQYLSYKSKVHSFVPRISAHKDKSPHRFNLKDALQSEKDTFKVIGAVYFIIILRWIFF